MEIRALTAADERAFLSLRREGLIESPRAFSESIGDHDATPAAVWTKRFAELSDHNFIVGAFDDAGELAGTVGCIRMTPEKSRHRAVIWGVYLKPQFRGSGAAKAMMLAAIRRARSIEGLEQLKLGVRADHNAARRLYLSLGFEACGIERQSIKVGQEYVDEETMVLFLKK